MKKILTFCGSTRAASVNLHIIKHIAELTAGKLRIEVYNQLGELPQFNPDLDTEDKLPASIKKLREKILEADGILICTPEYVFTLPGSLKNAIEWTVSTTVFSGKPTALITASGMGQKAHEALLLVMHTIQTVSNANTQLLISAAKSKLDIDGNITDDATKLQLQKLATQFALLVNEQVD